MSRVVAANLPKLDEPMPGESLAEWQTRLVMETLPKEHRTGAVQKIVYHGINGVLIKASELVRKGQPIPYDTVIYIEPAKIRPKARAR